MHEQVLQREITNFRSLSNTKTDKACAQAIADDNIHILINLNRSLNLHPLTNPKQASRHLSFQPRSRSNAAKPGTLHIPILFI